MPEDNRDIDFVLPWPEVAEPEPEPIAPVVPDESSADSAMSWAPTEPDSRPESPNRQLVQKSERPSDASPRIVLRLRRRRDEST